MRYLNKLNLKLIVMLLKSWKETIFAFRFVFSTNSNSKRKENSFGGKEKKETICFVLRFTLIVTVVMN